MTTTVRIAWNRNYDNVSMWNEVCAWAIETFGLPGERFLAHANVNHMEYVFFNKHDALMMSLRWNAPVVSEQDLAVETVSKFI